MSNFKTKELPDIKRGEYFTFNMQLLDANKAPIDLTVDKLACQIRNKAGELIDTCSVTRLEAGLFKFYVADTNAWPIATLELDIDVDHNSQPFTTTTFLLNVLKDITRPVT